MTRMILIGVCLSSSLFAYAGELEDEAQLQRMATEDVAAQLMLLRRDLKDNAPLSGANAVEGPSKKLNWYDDPNNPEVQSNNCIAAVREKNDGKITQADIAKCDRAFGLTPAYGD